MVVPALHGRGSGAGGLGRSGLGAGGGPSALVPVGRDSPIGLDLTRFLHAPDPFGQTEAQKRARQPALSDAETFEALRAPSAQMGQILSSRLAHVRVVAALWAAGHGGAQKAVEHVLNLGDQAVTVDVLGAIGAGLRHGLNLELGLDLLPTLGALLDSEYEDYLICGLTALTTVLKCLGPVVRQDADARAAMFGGFGGGGGGVDVAAEERHERCAALQAGLLRVEPRLADLAAGKGRPAQLAVRLRRSVERCCGEGSTPGAPGPE